VQSDKTSSLEKSSVCYTECYIEEIQSISPLRYIKDDPRTIILWSLDRRKARRMESEPKNCVEEDLKLTGAKGVRTQGNISGVDWLSISGEKSYFMR